MEPARSPATGGIRAPLGPWLGRMEDEMTYLCDDGNADHELPPACAPIAYAVKGGQFSN